MLSSSQLSSGWMQPAIGSQISRVQGFPSSGHTVVLPPTQTPPEQWSLEVQMLPSSHGSELFVWVQPVDGLHPSVVQTLPSSQLIVGPPWHVPALQTSFAVQALPSLHGAVLLWWKQPLVGLQPSSVQGLPSSQLIDAPP
jgi:hypothetical protein